MRLTIAYSKIKKRNLVLINNDTYQRETLSERPIRQPLRTLTFFLVLDMAYFTCCYYRSKLWKEGSKGEKIFCRSSLIFWFILLALTLSRQKQTYFITKSIFH